MTTTHLLRSRRETLAIQWTTRGAATLAIASFVALAAAAAAVYTGSRDIAPWLVTQILVGDYGQVTGFDVYTVLDNRLPRALSALMAGAAFGVSGAIFQRLTENPLGSPDLIGFSQGASAGAMVAIAFGGGIGVGVVAGALTGGLVAVVAVAALAWRRGLEGYRLLVVGIAVGAVLSAVSSFLLSRIEIEDAAAGYRWLVGGLAGRSWDAAALGAAGLAVLMPMIVAVHRGLDRLSVGEALARSQGLNVQRVRIMSALTGTGAVAVAVCVAGPVGFIALAAPHLARLVGRRPGPVLATSAAFGAALLASADVIAGRLFAPNQLPTGVVTAVLGGGYVVWLLQRRARGGRTA
ncbi:iron chelate uptake ABC transporter family permease subunit [Leucobacter sp. wl10]|uniref:FecCD family ABC transporter permease n=1 Tax=Leucobacter sp. wl10 TaxID=2304677 RepID=UPI000E5AC93A|nr:iron chelate uptake ABC transporter family permease subunit [Leucobacter sp. wl10]RGE20167.1 hypothetical protein D1J51_09585 [Leucobacter sp. wl10]